MRAVAILAISAAAGAAFLMPGLMLGGGAMAQDDTIVRVETGVLQGTAANGIFSFKNIPYAAPPVGNLRWRAPQPAAHWDGVRSAAAYGNDCIQNRFMFESAPSSQPLSEDCLNLNIWTPSANAKAKLPVMFWIHGGALITGSGSPAVYDGAAFARRGVVLVTINYRLGRFGFFAHPALTKENPDGPLGNYGLMDQIAALKWVQANIASFGGDPANVTIFGESAGGSSVNNLMVSPASTGLFAKAIVESGGGRERTPWLQDGHPEAGPSGEAAGRNFAESVGVKTDDVAALRAIPADDVKGDLQFWTNDPDTWTGAMIDGKILPKPAIEAFTHGEQHKLPYLIGTNSFEFGHPLFMGAMAGAARKKIAEMGEKGDQMLAIYGPLPRIAGKGGAVQAGLGKIGAEIVSDAAFVEPARTLAGLAAHAGQPTYLYQFAYISEDKRGELTGALHASEVPYVFNTLPVVPRETYSPADQAAAELVQTYWVNFAKTGNPNGAGLAEWPLYSAGEDRLLAFTNDGPAILRGYHRARLDFLAENAKPFGAAD